MGNSPWSDDEPTVPGTTLSFTTAFAWTPAEDVRSADDTLEGICLVQRIEPARLSGSGTQVKLTLRAARPSRSHPPACRAGSEGQALITFKFSSPLVFSGKLGN